MQAEATEQDLLRGFVRREGAAFERLVYAYQDRLYNFALRYCGTAQDAEEVVQDALVRAHRALYGRLTPERVLGLALTPWLYRIVLNTARNRARRRQLAITALPEGDELVPAALASDCGPERVVEANATRSAIVAALRALPDRYRVAVILRLVEGLGYAEIAAATGQPVGTVKSNVHRGALLMRPSLTVWWHDSSRMEARDVV
ncbi:MAG: RNA polymerase sigma factor [Chloroflexota bacterium]